MSKSKKAKVSSTNSQKNLFVMILCCAVLILGLSYFYLEAKNTPYVKAVPEKNTINVSDQMSGSKVTISKVTLEYPSFVIVRLEVEKGEPGKVIGVSKYLMDDTENVEIALYQKVLPDQKLTAEIRTDSDNNKKFNVQKDMEVNNTQGYKVETSFNIK